MSVKDYVCEDDLIEKIAESVSATFLNLGEIHAHDGVLATSLAYGALKAIWRLDEDDFVGEQSHVEWAMFLREALNEVIEFDNDDRKAKG